MLTFHSTVLFVKDINNAKNFYCQVLGMEIDMDMGKNVILKTGLALWEINEDNILIKTIGKDKTSTGNRGEMYFETDDIEKINTSLKSVNVKYIHDIHEEPWGQKNIRIYDPDGNIVEIGEELKAFLVRMIKSGMNREEITAKTGMTIEDIERTTGYPVPE